MAIDPNSAATIAIPAAAAAPVAAVAPAAAAPAASAPVAIVPVNIPWLLLPRERVTGLGVEEPSREGINVEGGVLMQRPQT